MTYLPWTQFRLVPHGLPLSVSTHATNHHEVRLQQLCFDFYMIEDMPGDPSNVRFWGNSGHQDLRTPCLLLTEAHINS